MNFILANLTYSQLPTSRYMSSHAVYFRWTDEHITRDTARSNYDTVYVFGDNIKASGMGGMAKELRGLQNAVGVPTKWAPFMSESAFFSDNSPQLDFIEDAIRSAITEATYLASQPNMNGNIVVPSGIGKGLADMPNRCPKLYEEMCRLLGKEGK